MRRPRVAIKRPNQYAEMAETKKLIVAGKPDSVAFPVMSSTMMLESEVETVTAPVESAWALRSTSRFLRTAVGNAPKIATKLTLGTGTTGEEAFTARVYRPRLGTKEK